MRWSRRRGSIRPTADTDADHVADGDEFNLYQTDPTIADTDGDGALDGEELFGRHTDPLLWDDGSTTGSEPAASSEPVGRTGPGIRTRRDQHAGGDRGTGGCRHGDQRQRGGVRGRRHRGAS